jgi:hypothetical protein
LKNLFRDSELPMKLVIKISALLLPALLIGFVPRSEAQTQPIINEHFPIRSGNQLSPPLVSPVGDCAQGVHVSGFIAHAIVRVFANKTELIGSDNPYFAEADIPLTRALKEGEKITATQEVLGIMSSQSPDPMVVSAYPSTLNKPVVDPPIYACGQVVPVDHLNPGTHVTVFEVGVSSPIGAGDATQAWQPIVTSPLNDGKQVFAKQTSCPSDPVKKMEAQSDPLTVLSSTPPVPPPTIEKPPLGADVVVLDGLLTGSAVEVSQVGSVIGGGFSTGSRNTAPVKRITAPTAITATQKLCTTSLPSAPVTPSTTLDAPVIVPPVCENTHYVTIRGTYPGAIIVLLRNGAVSTYSGGVLGDLTMALGGGAVWSLGDEIQVQQYVSSTVGTTLSGVSASVYANCAPQNVLTQHNDNSRSGAALHESKLTPKNVASSSFVKLFTRQVDGDVVGQPLFLKGARTSTGVKDLFLVTTSKNNLYAFDANDLTPAATSVWARNLCSSARSGVCGETYSRVVGITSTPVIDASTQAMYVVANCTAPGAPIVNDINNGVIRMYAINLKDGTNKLPPVDIDATDPSTPTTKFDPHCQRNRPGLLLSKGVVYAAFATFSCDVNCASNPYHGWVLGYRATDLKQTAAFCTSPTGGGAGIWQTGNGLAAASDGSIYFQTGNGPSDLANSFVKLEVSSTGALSKAGSFTPNNANSAMAPDERSLNLGDTDLGSGGPMLLPQGRLIGGGKQGRYYVLDQGTMALTQNATPDVNKFDGFQAFLNTYHQKDSTHTMHCAAAGGAAGCDPNTPPACFIDVRHYGDGELCGPNIHGGPVFWQVDSNRGFIYQMPEKDSLKAFRYDLTTMKVTETPLLTAAGSLAKPADGMPGGYSSISANGAKNGIVWTLLPTGDAQWNLAGGRMAAFDASTLKQIWSDPEDYMFAKAVPPTVADGKVIRATGSVPTGAPADFRVVAVYGLGKVRTSGAATVVPPARSDARVRACYTIEEKYANYGETQGILGTPTGPEIQLDDRSRGRYRNFRGRIFGMTANNASVEEAADSPIPTCSVPIGKDTEVDSSIYWTPRMCANVVQGEIRDYWLRLGGPKGKFGYPIGDETSTPDHRGRMSQFEHGEIWWYPEKGAYARPAKGKAAAKR